TRSYAKCQCSRCGEKASTASSTFVRSARFLMKVRGKMPRQRLIQLPLVGRVLLCLLAGVYLVYLGAFGRFLYTTVFVPSDTIIEYPVSTNSTIAIQHWTAASMSTATDADSQNSAA